MTEPSKPSEPRGILNLKNLRKRLDEALVEGGFASGSKEAQALIMAGQVIVNDQRITQASIKVRQDSAIRIKGAKKFVGRGGSKLEAAIKFFEIQPLVQGGTILDVGASTGGFTDCLLQHGAKKVIALDVGNNQLDWSLRTDPRVESLEKTDIRTYQPPAHQRFDLLVCDVSFIRLATILGALSRIMPHLEAKMLLLVKPQFELLSTKVPEGGIVDDPMLHRLCLDQVCCELQNYGIQASNPMPSPVRGRFGNQEFFVMGQRFRSDLADISDC